MSGLSGSLSMAARALQAQSYGLEMTGQNIANLNTPGYSRRIVQMAEVPPGSGGGVRIVGAPAQRDALIEGRLRRELPLAGRDTATAESLAVVETAFGSPGASLDGDLATFFDAWRSLSQDPTSPVARDTVVQQGTQLARSFNEMSSRLDQSLQEAADQVTGAVGAINGIARNVATLNESIAHANGADGESLKDRLGVELDSLAGLTGITVLRNQDGTADVTLGAGRPLVIGSNVYGLAVEPATTTGQSAVTSNGVDITRELTGGRIAGFLSVRDTLIPAYQAQVDRLAYDVAQQVNVVHQAGYDLAGVNGHDFFAAPAAVAGAARTIAISAGVAGDPALVAASSSGAVGDNRTADAIALLRDARGAGAGGTSTFTQAWGQVVYQVGSDSSTAQQDQVSREGIVTAVQRLRDSVSGVSLDEEAAAMIKYQRAYQANARFFVTIGETLDTLLQIA